MKGTTSPTNMKRLLLVGLLWIIGGPTNSMAANVRASNIDGITTKGERVLSDLEANQDDILRQLEESDNGREPGSV